MKGKAWATRGLGVLLSCVICTFPAVPGWSQETPLLPRNDELRTLQPDAILERNRQQQLEGERERRLREELRRKERDVVEEAPAEPTPEIPPEAKKPIIDLKQINFNESEILTEEELRELAAPLLGRKVSLVDLQGLVAQIDQLYRQKGFITAKAILPPQRIQEGVVRIQLIEARIGALELEGNEYTQGSYVRERLPFEPGDLADVREAGETLRRFNRLQDIGLAVTLRPGEEPGTTDYVVRVYEPRNYRVELYSDNFGQKSTGRARGGVNLSTPSLYGYRDPLFLGAHASEGVQGAYFSYELPVTRFDTRLGVRIDYSHVEIDDQRLGATLVEDLGGDTIDAGLTVSQPLLIRSEGIIRGFLEIGGRYSQLDILAINQAISTTDVRTFAGGMQIEWTDPWRGIWFAREGIVGVIDELGSDFVKYEGTLLRQQGFRPGLWASMRMTGQVSGATQVPASEQFQAGGSATVRGYPEGFGIGDDGYLVSAQINRMYPWETTIPPGINLTQSLWGFAFVDHSGFFAQGFRETRSGETETFTDARYLWGIGGGLGFGWKDYVNAQVSVGVPLTVRELDDVFAHASIRISPPVSDWLGW